MLNNLIHTLNMLSYQMSGLDPEEERRKQKVPSIFAVNFVVVVVIV